MGWKAGCWGFCPPHPNPTSAVGLWPQGWDGEAQSAPLSFADPWGSRTRERVWAALRPSPHPQPGAAPERKPRSQGPPAGIPGQGRQQLTAERALGGRPAAPRAPVPAAPPRRAVTRGKEVHCQLQPGLGLGGAPAWRGPGPRGKGTGTRVKRERGGSQTCSGGGR